MESFLNSRADRGIIYQGTDFSVDVMYSLLPVIIFLGMVGKWKRKLGFEVLRAASTLQFGKKMIGFHISKFFNELKDIKR